MHILRCMGSKSCVKFQRCPLKFHTKFWTHTPQNMHFTDCYFSLWFTISWNCDVISLSETSPRYWIKDQPAGPQKDSQQNVPYIGNWGVAYRIFYLLPGRFGKLRLPTSHYHDVIMTVMASQITGLTIVYSIVYSDVDQRKHQSSASLAFVWGIHRGPVNPPHKWPVTRKMFPSMALWKAVVTPFLTHS